MGLSESKGLLGSFEAAIAATHVRSPLRSRLHMFVHRCDRGNTCSFTAAIEATHVRSPPRLRQHMFVHRCDRGNTCSFTAAIAATDVRSHQANGSEATPRSPASDSISRQSRSATDVFGLFRFKDRGRLHPFTAADVQRRSKSATDVGLTAGQTRRMSRIRNRQRRR